MFDFFAKIFGVNYIISGIANLMLLLTSKILGMAGMFFNYVMQYTLKFSDLVKEVGVVDIGWTIFRDVSNMIFIFILLTIAIATILGIQSYGAKKLLSRVIIVALLINFSLFVSKVVIDTANVFTVGFYNNIMKNVGADEADSIDKGISAVFSQSLKLNTTYKGDEIKETDGKGNTINLWNILLVGIFGSVFLLVTAFIFFAGAILLFKRIIVLMLLMILSPLAFLGMILPATAGYSKQWWVTLFKEAFYAPIFMMFIYIVATGINSDAFTGSALGQVGANQDGFAAAITGGETAVIFFKFVLITGLLVASIISAEKIGAHGASGMVATGKKLQTWGQGKIKKGAAAMTFGAGGRLGRRVLGGNAQRLAEKLARSDYIAKGRFGSKLALKTLRYAGDASYDARNTAPAKALKLGEGIKGYKTQQEERKKKEIAYAKSLTGDSKTQATGVDGKPLTKTVNGREEPVMLSNTEVYAKKTADPSRRANIWNTVIGGAGARTGIQQAGEILIKEQEAKRKLKAEQDKLRSDKNPELAKLRNKLRSLKDTIKDLERQGTSTTKQQRQAGYEIEDEIKKQEAEIKERIEEAKANLAKAREKIKTDKANLAKAKEKIKTDKA